MLTHSRRGSKLQDVEGAQTPDEPDREEPPLLHGFERNLEAEEVLSFFLILPVVNFTNILQAAFAPISLRQKVQTYNVSTEKLLKRLLYEKAAHKMLVKLTPGRYCDCGLSDFFIAAKKN